MIHAKIDDDRFLDLVRKAPLIAFQRVEFGFAVAAPSEAYYAPICHMGGGNLPDNFPDALGAAFIKRMSTPALRTLRPTAKPIPTRALVDYLRTAFGDSPEATTNYDKAAGDHPAVVESECQIVILAIEENERPDLKDALKPLKSDVMSDALDLVIQHAESARELCEVGEEDKPELIRLHLLQSSRAMQTALEMLLRP
jgi:hypothetical protein